MQPKNRAINFFETPIPYLLPAGLFLGIFILYPLLQNIWISFFDWSVASRTRPFIGLDNYRGLLTSTEFFQALGNSLIWTLIGVSLQLFLGLLLSLALDKDSPSYHVGQFIALLPWIMPGVVAALMWRWMLQADLGVINQSLIQLGLIQRPILWLSNSRLALGSVIATQTWKSMPFWILMLTARLKSLDTHLLEAASIDGAKPFQLILYIKLPHLVPAIKAVAALMVVWTFQFFDIIYAMTGGGPGFSTTTLPLLMYRAGFESFRFGRSASIAVITALIVLLMGIPFIKRLAKEL